MAGLFKLGVHNLLDILPDRIAVRAQNGEALDARVLDQLCLAADVGVPLGKVDLHVGDLFHFLLVRHFAIILYG